MNMPNFLLIGAMRAGTTSFYNYLQQHPQVYMSPNKEPMFFGLEGEDLPFREPTDTKIHYRKPYTLEGYRELFGGVNNETAVGEASTWYLYLPQTPKCIRQHIPEVRLITILRHPADRAFSAYQYLRQGNREPLNDFAKALRVEEERIQQGYLPIWHYKRAGFYYEQLSRYYQIFDSSQIKVYLYDDWIKHPESMLRDVFQFLNIDDAILLNTSRKYNVSGVPRNILYSSFLSKPSILKSILKMFIPPDLRSRIRINMHKKLYFDPVLRHELTRVYRKDILSLQDLLQRDLSGWLAL